MNENITTTNNISNFLTAFVKAQQQMENASKNSSNPHLKKSYADLNSVREACIKPLNDNGIAVLQPIIEKDGKKYVKTLLAHVSGESMECLTEIIFNKQNDAQAQGSGITYARRYGLQSLVCIGVEDDDDGHKASQPSKTIQNLNNNQAIEIEDLAKKAKVDVLSAYKVEKYLDLPADKYDAIKQKLQKRLLEVKNDNS